MSTIVSILTRHGLAYNTSFDSLDNAVAAFNQPFIIVESDDQWIAISRNCIDIFEVHKVGEKSDDVSTQSDSRNKE